jgi:ketosteroid isomerase-like protein
MPLRTAILLVIGALLAQAALAARPASPAPRKPGQPPQEPYKCVDAGMVVYSDAPCVSATAAIPGQIGDLKRQQVEQLVASFDRTAGRRDWNGLADLIAEDAVIQIQRSPSRGGRSAIGKAEYRRLLNESGVKRRDYSLRRENLEIEMHPDGFRAQVASKLTQLWLDPGGPLMITSQESWVIEPRGGRPRIVIMDIVERDPKPQPPHSN